MGQTPASRLAVKRSFRYAILKTRRRRARPPGQVPGSRHTRRSHIQTKPTCRDSFVSVFTSRLLNGKKKKKRQAVKGFVEKPKQDWPGARVQGQASGAVYSRLRKVCHGGSSKCWPPRATSTAKQSRYNNPAASDFPEQPPPFK